MEFSQEAWGKITPIYDASIKLPFNQELAAGTLSTDRFRFYVLQDSLYLVAFSRALSVAAAKTNDTDAMVRFAESAREAIVVEANCTIRFSCNTGYRRRSSTTPNRLQTI